MHGCGPVGCRNSVVAALVRVSQEGHWKVLRFLHWNIVLDVGSGQTTGDVFGLDIPAYFEKYFDSDQGYFTCVCSMTHSR